MNTISAIQNYGMMNYSLKFKGNEKTVEKSATPLNENRPVAVSAGKDWVTFTGGKKLPLSPILKERAKESLAEIKRLGLDVDEEAKKLTKRYLNLLNRDMDLLNRHSFGTPEREKLTKDFTNYNYDVVEKGYDYVEGFTPIKLSAQSDEALLNLVEKYRPKEGYIDITGVHSMASKVLKERGVL